MVLFVVLFLEDCDGDGPDGEKGDEERARLAVAVVVVFGVVVLPTTMAL